MNTNSIPAGFRPAMVELPEDERAELVRPDVIEAVGATFSGLYSSIPTVRMLTEAGQLDSRCSSAPLTV